MTVENSWEKPQTINRYKTEGIYQYKSHFGEGNQTVLKQSYRDNKAASTADDNYQQREHMLFQIYFGY